MPSSPSSALSPSSGCAANNRLNRGSRGTAPTGKPLSPGAAADHPPVFGSLEALDLNSFVRHEFHFSIRRVCNTVTKCVSCASHWNSHSSSGVRAGGLGSLPTCSIPSLHLSPKMLCGLWPKEIVAFCLIL